MAPSAHERLSPALDHPRKRELDHAGARRGRRRPGRVGVEDQALGGGGWHNLASIDLREGRLSEAREKLERSLSIKRQVADGPGEAVTWHQMACIDLHRGTFLQPGRSSFARSRCARRSATGRARPRPSTSSGRWRRSWAGRRAAAGGAVVPHRRSIGHGDAESDLKRLQDMAASLGWSGERLQAVLQEAREAHARDRGWGLLGRRSRRGETDTGSRSSGHSSGGGPAPFRQPRLSATSDGRHSHHVSRIVRGRG
ncbi:MAG: tetratricopeptide repeat protein [Acetobacteraceae bacterium]|nr:tetratricopeptide repeat protein [Acetobacteraceae bacterium]